MLLTDCSPISSKPASSLRLTCSYTLPETQISTRLSHGLQPCGDVDAVTVQIEALHDHVAEIDAEAQHDTTVFRQIAIRCSHPVL